MTRAAKKKKFFLHFIPFIHVYPCSGTLGWTHGLLKLVSSGREGTVTAFLIIYAPLHPCQKQLRLTRFVPQGTEEPIRDTLKSIVSFN